MSRDWDSVWTIKQAYPNNRNLLKDHLQHAAVHSEILQDRQCRVADAAQGTRALSSFSDSVFGLVG